jgi:hypothetical protein
MTKMIRSNSEMESLRILENKTYTLAWTQKRNVTGFCHMQLIFLLEQHGSFTCSSKWEAL